MMVIKFYLKEIYNHEEHIINNISVYKFKIVEFFTFVIFIIYKICNTTIIIMIFYHRIINKYDPS